MWLVAALLAAGPVVASADSGVSLAGSGLLTIGDTSTLARGRFEVGLALDNRDRDPLGLDVFDYDLAFAVGVAPRLEAYGRAVVSRVVALPERPALPPPPLDLIVPQGSTAPAPPYYPLYAPAPYVNHRGAVRFQAFVPGDVVVGAKRRLVPVAGRRPGIAVGVELKLPLTRRADDLAAGAGTGAVDVTARGTLEWRTGRNAWLATAAWTRRGAPARGDRVLSGAAGPIDRPLQLPDALAVAAGWRRPISRRLALVGEATAEWPIGRRTRTLDETWPLDLLAGVQARLGRARLSLGLRDHAHAAASGALRPAPLAGFVDLTDVPPEALAAFLAAHGVAGALPQLRVGAQRVFAATVADPLPPGARRIPPTYRVRSEHQIGFVLVFSVSL
jgi:hypothetical protein